MANEKPSTEQEKLFTEIRVRRWDLLLERYRKNKFCRPEWIFRAEKQKKGGGENGKKYLQPAIRKAFDLFEPRCDLRELEARLIRDFRRRAHQYIDDPPAMNDVLEWMALMRHYGAPTRLLDWTYSFYVAVYLAVNECDCKGEDGKEPVVWTINANWLSELTEEVIERMIPPLHASSALVAEINGVDKDTPKQNEVIRRLMRARTRLLYHVTPFRRNEREIAQQGTFLCVGDVEESFENNLRGSLGVEVWTEFLREDSRANFYKLVLEIDAPERNKILEELYTMNINQAVLFPGLQGFAESLHRHLAYPGRKFGDLKKEKKK